jgi:hypothetical protein
VVDLFECMMMHRLTNPKFASQGDSPVLLESVAQKLQIALLIFF